MSKIDELRLGFETAYINGSAASNSLYRPVMICGRKTGHQKCVIREVMEPAGHLRR